MRVRLALSSGVEQFADRAVLRAARLRRRGTGRHVVVAGPGGGSVGDQAMLENFCRHVDGPVLVLVRDLGSLMPMPADLAGRTQVKAVPDLLYGPMRRHVRSLLGLARELATARSFSVVGADVMDGVYSLRSSMRRFQLADSVGRAGVPARVLGFSWNTEPHPRAAAAMRACRSAVLCARDPGSAGRLRADGAQSVMDVADLAFLPGPSDPLPPPVEEWLAQRTGSAVVVLNANALLQRRVDQVAALVGVVERWADEGVHFVLISHDGRGDVSDGSLAEEVRSGVSRPENLLVVPGVLSPGAVRALCERASFVVTGRMHLAILAARVGTPSVATSYQGKLRGLYDRLGIDTLVEPDETYRLSVDQQVAHLVRHSADAARTIAKNLPALEELARRNLPPA